MVAPSLCARIDTTHRERFGSVAREFVPMALMIAANKSDEGLLIARWGAIGRIPKPFSEQSVQVIVVPARKLGANVCASFLANRIIQGFWVPTRRGRLSRSRLGTDGIEVAPRHSQKRLFAVAAILNRQMIAWKTVALHDGGNFKLEAAERPFGTRLFEESL